MLMAMGRAENMPKFSTLSQTGLKWIWISLLFLLLDQYTKYLAVTYIQPYETIEVMPFFNLVIRYNAGAAFSFLADAGGWQVFFFSGLSFLISGGIIFYMYKLPATQRWTSIALAFILAGALGNLYDRLTLEKVVDFIDWYYGDSHWPAFNIADSVIMLGAGMLLVEGFFTSEKKDDKSK